MTKSIPTLPTTGTSLAAQLFELAGELQEFCHEMTESLSFDDYSNLSFWEAKLLAYGNLLTIQQKTPFLEAELQDARDLLDYTRTRLI